MAPLLTQAGQAAGTWVRQELCQNTGNLLDNLPAIGKAGRSAREIARGIHAGLCGLPTPPELGESGPPLFSGGQCQGVLYRVTVYYKRPTDAIEFNVSCAGAVFAGPIQGASIFLPPASPGAGAVLIQHAGTQTACATSFGGGQFTDAVITRMEVSRQDGLPDNCGNPPVTPPPPPPPPLPPPPDIDLPVTPPGGGPDINLTFSPRIGPVFVGVGGALIVPVNVRVSGPLISVDAPISIPVHVSLPDLNISFPGAGSDDDPVDDPSEPTPPGPPPRPVPGPPRQICCRPTPETDEPVEGEPGEPTEGSPAPPRRRLIGIVVTSAFNEGQFRGTQIGQGGAARDLFLPRLANVYFDVETGQGLQLRRSTVGPAPVQLKSQYFPAPANVTVTGWRILPEPGVRTTAVGVLVAAASTPTPAIG